MEDSFYVKQVLAYWGLTFLSPIIHVCWNPRLISLKTFVKIGTYLKHNKGGDIGCYALILRHVPHYDNSPTGLGKCLLVVTNYDASNM